LFLLLAIAVVSACNTERRETQLVHAMVPQTNAQALAKDGTHLLRRGDRAAAEAVFRLSLKHEDSAVVRNNLGVIFFERRQYPAAAAEFAHAVRLDPGNADTLSNLGLAWEAMNRVEVAADFYKSALELEPNHVRAQRNFARATLRAGNDDAISTRSILLDLLANETDSRWIEWAHKELVKLQDTYPDPRSSLQD